MRRNTKTMLLMLAMVWGAIVSGAAPPEVPDKTTPDGQEAVETEGQNLPTVEEARGRARLLQDTIHSTLQIVHHQYYRENQGLPLPARTLKVVFNEVARRRHVNLQWLVVNADAGSVDHNPKNEFEKDAARALAAGKQEFELVEHGVYRHVGAITLSSECLSCHLPNRTSSKDRTAGLVITMPIKPG
jgi:Protein of unknown function (DUF3365)